MMKKINFLLCCLLFSLFWLLPAQAQETENEGVARVALITPKEGHDDALIKAITDYHHWIANFEGHHEYTWFEILTGPDTGKYIARTGGHNWADFDTSYDWQEEAADVFTKNVAPHMQEATVQMTEEMKDFSHWPDSFEGYTHFQVENWYVHNGKGREFRQGLRKIVDTLKAANYPNYWGFFSVESGAHGNQVQLVSANRGWSDMSDPDPSFFSIMSQALGGEEAFHAFMSDWTATFKTGHNQMVKRMPEASDYGK
jgi:quinol monooxygenase YgiN